MSYLYTSVTAQVEVKLGWVSDAHVYGGSGGDVATLADLILLVGAEQSGVVALLHHDEGDSGLITHLQLHARFSHGSQFMRQYLHHKNSPLSKDVLFVHDLNSQPKKKIKCGDV